MALLAAAAPSDAGSCDTVHLSRAPSRMATDTHLVLRERGNLGVDRRELRAEHALDAHAAGVALDGAVDERARHALDITRGLRVRERAVRDAGLQAVRAALRTDQGGLQCASGRAGGRTAKLPMPCEAAALPSNPKTASTMPSGLLCCKNVLTTRSCFS